MDRIIAAFLATIIFLAVSSSFAQDRPTVQNRFAKKSGALSGHIIGTTHIRNDFYDAYGFGLDLDFYIGESFGLEVRGLLIDTSLSPAALDLKERTGLTPDTYPQFGMILGGARYSLGYGKLMIFKNLIVHFDPQVFVHGGVAFAERRVIPTVLYGLSLLNHFRWGLQFKVDLAGTFQLEERSDRGSVSSFGFMPIFGFGWNSGILSGGGP